MTSDKIRSVNDLFDSVIGTSFIEKHHIFRGQNNISWKIKPQMTRAKVNDDIKVFESASFLALHQDKNIPFLVGKDPIEYLSVLQHYNVQTRLLDFSKDPLIALFFACYDPMNENTEKDGEFIVTKSTHYPDITLRSIDNPFFIEKFNKGPNELYKSRIYSTNIKYFETVFQNPRSRSQNGCFLFFPFATINKDDSEYPCLETYIEWVNRSNEKQGSKNRMLLARKPVDKDYKESILKELEIKYSISYKTIMIPDTNNLYIDQEFKNFVKRINCSFDELKEAYIKWNVANNK
jgi:hypothetical protein